MDHLFLPSLYHSCSLQSELPGSACASDGDCAYLANTVCRLKTSSASAAAVKVKVCQCMEGFQPIPGMMKIYHIKKKKSNFGINC